MRDLFAGGATTDNFRNRNRNRNRNTRREDSNGAHSDLGSV
jgi:hypothetical protein